MGGAVSALASVGLGGWPDRRSGAPGGSVSGRPAGVLPDHPNPVGIPELTPGVFATLTRVYFVLLLLSAGSLLIRFRRAHREERQQLKWVAYTASLIGLQTLVGPWLPVDMNAVLSTLSNVAFAAAIAVAILKYRLYDIDRLINRTLVYGLLTAILGAGYVGAVLVLGQLFGEMGGEPPSWAIAGTTLAVAALLQPVRQRIQAVVDRRFNRRKYDAVRTVEAFSTRLREQVDLDALSDELLAVIDQTMQPTTASLWLRETARAP
jgi:hypothetical protein